MSPPQLKPYAEGQTGSLSDVIERGPELAPVTPAGPGGFAPDPSWSQMFTAARPGALRSTPLYDETKIGQGYAPIVDALGLPPSENPGYFGDLDAAGVARFGNAGGRPSSLATSAKQGETLFGNVYLADRSLQEYLVTEQIKARRAKDPNFLPGVPDNVEGLHTYFEQQQAKARAAGASVLARGSTFGRVTASLAAGGVESAANDPTFLPTMLLGGGTATSVLQAVGRDALINGVIAAAQLPQQAANMAENDEHLTVGDAVSQVATAAAIGAAAGGAVHLAVAHVPPALFKVMPESVQTRWAGRMRVGDEKAAPLLKDVLGDMDNRELSTFARSTIGTRMTPDEKAAAHVLERSQELGEASPFEPGPEGDAAHNANLATSLKSIIDGAPTEGPKADLLTSTSPLGLRPPRPVATPLDASFEAQWHAIVGNEGGTGPHGEFLTSPKGAIGPAQVMPGTAPYAAKLAGLPWDEARYRSDPAYNQALGRAYYAEQLHTFGDPDMAAAAYNAGPGSAARGTGLRGAMKRAAEHGEPGNWEAYLPHETQRYVENFRKRAGGSAAGEPAIAAGGEDELAALQRSADEAEAQTIELGRGREQADFATGDRADVADVPLLKRELFGSDEQWADAQAGFHQSLNGPEEAAGAPLSAETPSGPPEVAAAVHAALGAAAEPQVGELWRLSQDQLQELLDRKRMSDREQLVQAFGSEDIAKRFEALDRQSNSMDPRRADEGSRLLEQEFGDLTTEQQRLVYGIGETDAQVDELKQLIQAHSDVLPGDDQSWSAYMAAHAARRTSAEEFAKVPEGRGTIAAQAEYVRMASAYRNLAAAGVSADEIPKRMAEALVQRGGWPPEQASEVIGHFVDGMLGLGERAQRPPQLQLASARIDDPALKDFEPGAAGPKEQVGSLEHDARMAADDPATAKRVYQIDEGGKPRTLIDILDELDAEEAAAKALRACAGAAA